MNKEAIIQSACEQFVRALGEHVTDETVFATLNDMAQIAGCHIAAYQRGIQGTFIVFEKVK